ncbi:uncharacterized protein LOC111592194 [Drosophila hydei]|uniref:Uncharacterized protein LOC111592194 n=1 Tax=Drosophila hydei TaxID=7224 RepID=A0A6J1L316_DROHY|nr:uncharacterized protein LOC111592194 [Drosophila hydei]
MRLMKCCCCISLQFGTLMFGCLFGLVDFYLGSLGVYYVSIDEMPKKITVFFDKMDARLCVFWFAVIYYIIAFSDLLLIAGAMAKNPTCLGPWLIVNFIVLICTIATVLLSVLAVVRVGILLYAILVVNSFYDELTAGLFI